MQCPVDAAEVSIPDERSRLVLITVFGWVLSGQGMCSADRSLPQQGVTCTERSLTNSWVESTQSGISIGFKTSV